MCKWSRNICQYVFVKKQYWSGKALRESALLLWSGVVPWYQDKAQKDRRTVKRVFE